MSGVIEVICGPMFAGKTEELVRLATRLDFAKKEYVVFSPSMDTRYSATEIVSHSNYKKQSVKIASSKEILQHITKNTNTIFVDEVQFFDTEIVEVVEQLVNSGIRVVLGGLDTDYLGNPFELTAIFLAKADKVTKLSSICSLCGSDATKTKRISTSDELIMLGASDKYEPRCRKCHQK